MNSASEGFRESELLGLIRARSASLSPPGLLVGPGDDCAVVGMPSGDRCLLTVDQVIVGRHVTAATPLLLLVFPQCLPLPLPLPPPRPQHVCYPRSPFGSFRSCAPCLK